MSQPMARGIERWPLDKLIPYAKNPRTHSDTQVAQIAKSIREFGFTNPLLVDSQCSIIAGHGRLLAARQLRMTEVPVIVLDHLTDAQKRAYILADNQLALNAGWDDQLLPAELASLKELEYDLHLIGFDDEELARLLAGQDATEGLTNEDAIREITEAPVTMAGDLWLLGDHRVLCGDAMKQPDVNWLGAGDAADIVFTDSP